MSYPPVLLKPVGELEALLAYLEQKAGCRSVCVSFTILFFPPIFSA